MPAENNGAPSRGRASFIALLLLFSQVGLSSFGGAAAPRLQKEFVEVRGWLSEMEFSAAFALAQIMPGASVVNLSALIGYRLMRLPGALAAVLGLLIGPGVAAIGLASLAHHWAGWTLSAALQGMAASAAGLLFSMGLKTGSKMVRLVFSSAGKEAEAVAALSVLTATFVLVGLFRFPTAAVVLCLAPCSVALALLTRKKGRR
jgi:chromate transporter